MRRLSLIACSLVIASAPALAADTAPRVGAARMPLGYGIVEFEVRSSVSEELIPNATVAIVSKSGLPPGAKARHQRVTTDGSGRARVVLHVGTWMGSVGHGNAAPASPVAFRVLPGKSAVILIAPPYD